MAQPHDSDSGSESDEGVVCDPDLAEILESDGEERGEEAALALLRLTARITDTDPDDIEAMYDPQFAHELMHALTGFLHGLFSTLDDDTELGEKNVALALGDTLAWVIAAGPGHLIGGRDDAGDIVTELEDEQMEAFLEMARATGVPSMDAAAEELAAGIDGAIDELVDDAMAAASVDAGRAPHVAAVKGLVLASLIRTLAQRLRTVPDVGYGLLRVAVSTVVEESTDDQQDATMAAATEGPAAVRRAQSQARAAAKAAGAIPPRKAAARKRGKASSPSKPPRAKPRQRK